MGHVRLLDRSVSERIAAGEVVERPSSVVKELVENSLDAGATRIEVALRQGGQELILIKDDGCGMAREDALLALERFATSKIAAWEDMERITTLGFRGEALPSIAAVSRMEIFTRAREEEAGVHIEVEGGAVKEVREMGLPQGTTIEVRDLFFNTPARRKFLKSAAWEASQVIELMGRLALAYPDVHVTVENMGKKVLDLPVQLSVRQRLVNLWKLEHQSDLLDLHFESPGLSVRGLISRPGVVRPTRRDQIFFVNGRLVRSTLVSQAIQEGYRTLMAMEKFPLSLVFVEMDNALVDINVHPTKSEIRLASSGDLFRALKSAVTSALSGSSAAAGSVPQATSGYAREGGGAYHVGSPWTSSPARATQQSLFPLDLAADDAGKAVQPVAALPGRPLPLAQLDKTYVAYLHDGALWLVDQHAAHERINYERLKAAQGPSVFQELLFPHLLDFTPAEAAILTESLDVLESAGFLLEPFGGESFIVRAAPWALERLHVQESIRELLEEFLSSKEPLDRDARRERLLQLAACHSSIRAGEEISREEMVQLFDDLTKTSNPFFCPHGRPAAVVFGAAEMARLFKR